MDPVRHDGRPLRQPDRRPGGRADDRRHPNGRALADDRATGNLFALEKVEPQGGGSDEVRAVLHDLETEHPVLGDTCRSHAEDWSDAAK
jgi:hypothetical protein